MLQLDHSNHTYDDSGMSKTVQGQTLLEIAKARGVSYEAICHMKDRRDIQPIGKRGRAALYNPEGFVEKKQSEAVQQSSDFRRRYEAARAEKLEIQNAKARGDLIGRVLIARVFSEIYNVDRSILLNIGPGLSGTIAAIVEGGAADRALKIQKIIDGEIYAALGAIKAAINKFLRGIEAGEIKDDIPEPKPQIKRKPAAKKKKKPTG
jgi:hypothetical protein